MDNKNKNNAIIVQSIDVEESDRMARRHSLCYHGEDEEQILKAIKNQSEKQETKKGSIENNFTETNTKKMLDFSQEEIDYYDELAKIQANGGYN